MLDLFAVLQESLQNDSWIASSFLFQTFPFIQYHLGTFHVPGWRGSRTKTPTFLFF